MGKSRGSARRADRSYQATIAEALARNFGVESAIETCRRFRWHDALVVLLAWKYGPEGRACRAARKRAALAAAGVPRRALAAARTAPASAARTPATAVKPHSAALKTPATALKKPERRPYSPGPALPGASRDAYAE